MIPFQERLCCRRWFVLCGDFSNHLKQPIQVTEALVVDSCLVVNSILSCSDLRLSIQSIHLASNRLATRRYQSSLLEYSYQMVVVVNSCCCFRLPDSSLPRHRAAPSLASSVVAVVVRYNDHQCCCYHHLDSSSSSSWSIAGVASVLCCRLGVSSGPWDWLKRSIPAGLPYTRCRSRKTEQK